MVEAVQISCPVAHAVRVQSITSESPGVASYRLRSLDPILDDSFRWLPGQFNVIDVPNLGEVASNISDFDAATCTWTHTIRNAGQAAAEWERVRVGTLMNLRGPFGNGWPIESCQGHDVVLLAGGLGLTALQSAIEAIISQRLLFGRVSLIYGARTPGDLLFAGKLDRWMRHKIDVSTTVDRAAAGWRGSIGAVPMLLDRLRLAAPTNTAVLTSGPEVMMRYALRSALERGVRSRLVWLSLERCMQCVAGSSLELGR